MVQYLRMSLAETSEHYKKKGGATTEEIMTLGNY